MLAFHCSARFLKPLGAASLYISDKGYACSLDPKKKHSMSEMSQKMLHGGDPNEREIVLRSKSDVMCHGTPKERLNAMWNFVELLGDPKVSSVNKMRLVQILTWLNINGKLRNLEINWSEKREIIKALEANIAHLAEESNDTALLQAVRNSPSYWDLKTGSHSLWRPNSYEQKSSPAPTKAKTEIDNYRAVDTYVEKAHREAFIESWNKKQGPEHNA